MYPYVHMSCPVLSCPLSPCQGEESVKERFTLDEAKVVPFLEQEYTLEQVRADGAGFARTSLVV